MKSKKIDYEQQLEYPCLMESTLTGAVVLFVGEHEGMQVTKEETPENTGCGLGHYSEDWNASYDSERWKPFNGKIILEND